MTTIADLTTDLNLYSEELALEKECRDIAKARYLKPLITPDAHDEKHQKQGTSLLSTPAGNRILEAATLAVAEALKTEVANLDREGNSGNRGKAAREERLAYWQDLLDLMSYEEIAYTTVRSVMLACCRPQAQTAASLARKIMLNIENLAQYKEWLKVERNYIEAVHDAKSTSQSPERTAKVLTHLATEHGIPRPELSEVQTATLGHWLYTACLEEGGFFEVRTVKNSKRSLQYFEWLPSVEAMMSDLHDRIAQLQTFSLPMVSPPRPWNSLDNGGYLIPTTRKRRYFIRVRKQADIDALPVTGWSEHMRGVNSVQSTRWTVNKPVLKVLRDLFNAGGGQADIPRLEVETPVKPWSSDEEYQWFYDKDPETITDWKRTAALAWQAWAKEKSNLAKIRTRLDWGDRLGQYDQFWCPHSCDWRGRLYASNNWFGPQEDDIGKGILMFADGLPLGERGVYWLHVHAANCFGEDKLPMDERAAWAEANTRQMLQVAADPHACKWWQDASDPWRFLAACYEIEGLHREGSSFRSRLPIAQDGSCNGLQHFSAILRDPEGAMHTNLVPSLEPQDIYMEVLRRVLKILEGSETPWYNLDRDLMKAPVMTTPYGVTTYGIQCQLYSKVCENPGKYLPESMGQREWNKQCGVLAGIITEAVSGAVSAADTVKVWLQQCAQVCVGLNQPVLWTSPTGFTVRQDCPKYTSTRVTSMYCKTRIRLRIRQHLNEQDKAQHVQGISPNYVHSLDAAHLIRTVNTATESGIDSLAVIHDSYGTHAAKTDQLNQILRYEFCQMYRENVLEKFRQEIVAQVPQGTEVPEVPQLGEFDPSVVINSRYFFA